MSKIYYGDENNTAVELNIGVSQEYVDGQIEAVSADMHSIPAGGTAGQVLSKVDGTDYNAAWADPNAGGFQYWNETGNEGTYTATLTNNLGQGTSQVFSDFNDIGLRYIRDGYLTRYVSVGTNGIAIMDKDTSAEAGFVLTLTDTIGHAEWKPAPTSSDPNAIKIDGTSVTTAQIPFAQGISAAGSSAFTGTVTVPTPTANEHAANKQYVDEAVAGAGGGSAFTPTAVCDYIYGLEQSIANPLYTLEDPATQVWASVTQNNPKPDIEFSAIKISDKWWKVYLKTDVFVGSQSRLDSNFSPAITVNLTGVLEYMFTKNSMGSINKNATTIPGNMTTGFHINSVPKGESYGYARNKLLETWTLNTNPFSDLDEVYLTGEDECDGSHILSFDGYIPVA